MLLFLKLTGSDTYVLYYIFVYTQILTVYYCHIYLLSGPVGWRGGHRLGAVFS